MLPRLIRIVFALVLLTAPALSAGAQTDARSVDVIDLSGPFDDRLVQFAIDSIEQAGEARDVEVVILQIDGPAAIGSAEKLRALGELVADPPVPVVAWVGPAPAVVQGGVAQVFIRAQLRAAAPGARIGYWTPTIAGNAAAPLLSEPPTKEVLADPITLDAPIAGLVDLVQPETAAVRQLVQLLDGMTVGGTELHTVEPFTAPDGTSGVTALTTVIRQPGLWDRFLRLASRPEAAFFFLVAGLTVAAFEFYAIGPGIAAGVAALSLLIAGYGLAVLPVRWWALALTGGCVVVLSWAFQRGGATLISLLALAGLVVSGLAFTATAPQLRPGVPGVVLTVGAGAFFFLLAMPTVARSRFSTQTIGREHLVEKRGIATSDLTPDGEVEVEGARWRATSHREAGIKAGDVVIVVGIDGWYLEVEPPIA